MTIVADVEQCGACHLCETACSLGRESECNPAVSRIRVLRGEMLEALVVCQQCEVLFCGSVCPTKAIHRDPVSGAILVDEERCTGCRACVKACPYGVVAFHPGRKKALICDQCGGKPFCVDWCPRQALHFVEITASSIEKKRESAEKAFSLLQKLGS